MSRRFCALLRNSFTGILFVVLIAAPLANAAVPEWLRQAARAPLPAYKAETGAVVLLDEVITTVADNGEIHTIYRRAVKILRPNSRDYGNIRVHFDNETKLTWLKGWSISSTGEEYEVKEKDAIETNGIGSDMYTDSKMKLLSIPASAVGSVIGYEYQQKRRPTVYQDWWTFQEDIPVRTCRYTLRLPKGWEYETFWNTQQHLEPKNGVSGETTWEVTDVPELEEEDYRPPYLSLAGRMVLHFFASTPDAKNKQAATWSAIGSWYANLAQGRRAPSPEIKLQVTTLTAGAKTTLDKMNALASWVQKDIRYVSVEIGIGGYQPRYASEVFTNRFGDCKDKVTLLSTMLHEIGIESEYVLVHTSRGVVKQEMPTSLTFNHVILAIKLPADVPTKDLYAIYQHPKLGAYLIFDPTSELTALGDLPPLLQQNLGLMLNSSSGEIIEIPLLAPTVNRLVRKGTMQLTPEGKLSGRVEEYRTGAVAEDSRAQLLNAELSNRSKSIESFLSNSLGNFDLTKAEVGDLEDYHRPLILRYVFQVPEYAKRNGPLMLVRPRVLGQKSMSVAEGKKRHYPIEFESARDESDSFEIDLPAGYEVDELPDAVDVAFDFGEYHSKIEQVPGKLKYSRHYIIKRVIVPTDRMEDLKKFYREIAADERGLAVLKKTAN